MAHHRGGAGGLRLRMTGAGVAGRRRVAVGGLRLRMTGVRVAYRRRVEVGGLHLRMTGVRVAARRRVVVGGLGLMTDVGGRLLPGLWMNLHQGGRCGSRSGYCLGEPYLGLSFCVCVVQKLRI